jgi:hypothetical protein
LYDRGRGRGLLLDAPYRTAPEAREIFRDQIDEVLVPKRGQSNPPVNTITEAHHPAAKTFDTTRSAVLKLIKLTKKGQFTADDALILIEAALNT